MTKLTKEEIEQLKQQLKEKQEEVNAIYDQLVEAGVVPLPDDFLDGVAGGIHVPTRVPSHAPESELTPTVIVGDPRP